MDGLPAARRASHLPFVRASKRTATRAGMQSDLVRPPRTKRLPLRWPESRAPGFGADPPRDGLAGGDDALRSRRRSSGVSGSGPETEGLQAVVRGEVLGRGKALQDAVQSIVVVERSIVVVEMWKAVDQRVELGEPVG